MLTPNPDQMPMTIIEAMGTGLPIVASRVGGVPDMLRDGESGLLVGCGPDEVCAACERLIDSEDLRAERAGGQRPFFRGDHGKTILRRI